MTEIVSGRIIADIRRNYGHFWHAWVFRGEREEYLLCGEDYQGYNVIDLVTAGNFVEFPEPGYQGDGFCWVAAHPSPDGKILAVEGCYWACPYELVFFDFSNPSMLPLPELSRADFYEVAEGWAGDGEFRYTVEDPACEGDPRPPILPAVWPEDGFLDQVTLSSSRFAAARASLLTSTPPSIRASSSCRSFGPSRCTALWVMPAASALLTR